MLLMETAQIQLSSRQGQSLPCGSGPEALLGDVVWVTAAVCMCEAFIWFVPASCTVHDVGHIKKHAKVSLKGW
jgi:hypothetical protein